MKEIVLKKMDQTLYVEQLENGLKVILIPMNLKGNYYVNYTTKYGSIDLKFKQNGKVIDSPKGIAHFLEHKMFEQESGIDVFDYYSKTGTECNAGTSYEKTSYYIYGINDLKENLNFLLDFVNSPYFTDENVLKEKGIIIEELKMYSDNPEWIMNETLQKATFKNHPIRYDIGGYTDTVEKITTDDLYKCYNAFYQPGNMVLVISGNFNKDEIIDTIKSNKALMNKKNSIKISRIYEKEPLSVVEKYNEVLHKNVMVPKICINFKLSTKECENKVEFILYVTALLSILFGSASSFSEDMFKKGYASYIDFNKMILDDFLLIEFYAEGEKPKELLNEIINRFKNYEVDEIEFNRFKKVTISAIVINSDKPQAIAEEILNDYIKFGKIFEDKIDMIKSLKYDELNKIRKSLRLNNNSTVLLKQKDK